MLISSFVINSNNRNSLIIQKMYIIAVCAIMTVLHLWYPDKESIVSIVLILCSSFVNAELSICVYLCSFVIQVEYLDVQEKIILMFMFLLTLFVIVRSNVIKRFYHYSVVFFLFFVISLMSTLVGYEAKYISNLMLLKQLLLIIVIAYFCLKGSNLILYTLVTAGLFIGLYVFYQVISGNASYFGMSLVYGDGDEAAKVKAFSTCIAIPAYYYIHRFFFGDARFFTRWLYLLVFIICLALIILTFSRAVLVAISFSLLLILCYYFKEKRTLSHAIVILFLVGCVTFLVSQMEFNEDKMLNNIETGSGRTDIWSFYFSKMLDGGFTRVLFGFGLGDSKRITEGTLYSGFYSHSVFVDYIVSFGLWGIVFIGYLVGSVVKRLYLKHCVFYLGLLTLSSLMFFTHGSSINLLFHSILAMCLGNSMKGESFQYNGKFGLKQTESLNNNISAV